MHCVLTADLAALMSEHGLAILRTRELIPSEAITQYWTSTRNRFELWHQTLARYRRAEESGDVLQLRQWWKDHAGVLEEILVTEMLTRVIAAIGAGLDDPHEDDEVSPITHAVHLSHLEARNRVQRIMLLGRGNSVHQAIRLNRLRRTVEHWTDLLVGRVAADSMKPAKYGINVHRTEQFASETRAQGFGSLSRTSARLLNVAMHESIRRQTDTQVALPQANQLVASSVLMMLRPDLFDSVGILKSLWLHRLQSGTDHADRVIDELQFPNISHAPTACAMEMLSDDHLGRWYV